MKSVCVLGALSVQVLVVVVIARSRGYSFGSCMASLHEKYLIQPGSCASSQNITNPVYPMATEERSMNHSRSKRAYRIQTGTLNYKY